MLFSFIFELRIEISYIITYIKHKSAFVMSIFHIAINFVVCVVCDTNNYFHYYFFYYNYI